MCNQGRLNVGFLMFSLLIGIGLAVLYAFGIIVNVLGVVVFLTVFASVMFIITLVLVVRTSLTGNDTPLICGERRSSLITDVIFRFFGGIATSSIIAIIGGIIFVLTFPAVIAGALALFILVTAFVYMILLAYCCINILIRADD